MDTTRGPDIQMVSAQGTLAAFTWTLALLHGKTHWFSPVAVAGLALSLGFAYWAWSHQAKPTRYLHIPQQIACTGPYLYMRHPIYTASLIFHLSIPLLWPSLGHLFTLPPLLILIILRMINEDQYLKSESGVYRAYALLVPFKVLPCPPRLRLP